jgi:hypothetical protein
VLSQDGDALLAAFRSAALVGCVLASLAGITAWLTLDHGRAPADGTGR